MSHASDISAPCVGLNMVSASEVPININAPVEGLNMAVVRTTRPGKSSSETDWRSAGGRGAKVHRKLSYNNDENILKTLR